MGFIGIIVLVVIGIICYNIWFNLKYTEGEQIMMRHKKEKAQREKISKKVKEHLRSEYFPDIENPKKELFIIVNKNLTESQKSIILIMLTIVSIEFDEQQRIKHTQYIYGLYNKFNLRDDLKNTRVYNNHSLLKERLELFEKNQKLYLIFYLMDMFVSDGGIDDDKIEIVQNKIVDYCSITDDEFNSFIEKVYELRLFYN